MILVSTTAELPPTTLPLQPLTNSQVDAQQACEFAKRPQKYMLAYQKHALESTISPTHHELEALVKSCYKDDDVESQKRKPKK